MIAALVETLLRAAATEYAVVVRRSWFFVANDPKLTSYYAASVLRYPLPADALFTEGTPS